MAHPSPTLQPSRPDGFDPRSVNRADRVRLSGPGLRAFLAIADAWSLSEKDRLAVLGRPGRSSYHNWVRQARMGGMPALPLDTLLRISAVLGIHKALSILFPRGGDGMAWLTAPNSGPMFGGQAPLQLVVSGTQDGLLLVRRYLDAWRGGRAAGPMGDDQVEGRPIADEDIIIP